MSEIKKKIKINKKTSQVHDLPFFRETKRWFIQWHSSYLPFLYGKSSWWVLPQLNSCVSTVSNQEGRLAQGTTEKKIWSKTCWHIHRAFLQKSEEFTQGTEKKKRKKTLAEVLVLSKLDSHYQRTVEWKIKEDSKGLSWKAKWRAKSMRKIRKKSTQKGKNSCLAKEIEEKSSKVLEAISQG